MAISSEQFRDVLRLFPAGVTLVTTRTADGRTHGMTVSAFASVSPEPPLVTVIIDHSHTMHPMLEAEGAVFAVNILGEEQQELSNRFAFTKDQDRFAEGSWSTGTTGAPVLENAIAWLDCAVVGRHEAGTHTVYLGEVLESRVLGDRQPLVYWNRGYRRLVEPVEP
ncbi:MAG: flavin reductase family protein [Acidobacteriota bacterium]